MSVIPGQGWSDNKSVFQLGKNKTLAVPLIDTHQGNRQNLINILKSRDVTTGIILVKGGSDGCKYDTDQEIVFQQDSWFQYLFGCREPNFWGLVHISTLKSCLFIPRLPQEYEIWCGKILPNDYFKQHYAVSEVYYDDEMASYLLNNVNVETGNIHVLEGLNSDSGTLLKAAVIPNIESLYSENRIVSDVLFHALSTSRTVKSAAEIEIMRYAAFIASNAHVSVMKSTKPGMFEFELEALFLYNIYAQGGARHSAYTSICACGPNAATLHYGHAAYPNDRQLLESDIALLDMGANYHGYCSDITCSFPVSGKFSDKQRKIFQGVLNAQIAVLDAVKPGVSWVHCHYLAEIEIIKALLDIGILIDKGKSLDELQQMGLGAIFFPHGLGHLIGLDTHDVGGYIDGTPERRLEPGMRKLRTARLLDEGYCMTNEPGCYFIDYLLDSALNDETLSSHIDNTILQGYRGFGGVRLEDVILVTATGVENLTLCPRTIEEIEQVLSGGQWPPVVDEAPQLRRQWVKLNENGLGMSKIVLG